MAKPSGSRQNQEELLSFLYFFLDFFETSVYNDFGLDRSPVCSHVPPRGDELDTAIFLKKGNRLKKHKVFFPTPNDRGRCHLTRKLLDHTDQGCDSHLYGGRVGGGIGFHSQSGFTLALALSLVITAGPWDILQP